MKDYSSRLLDEAIVYAEVLADWFGHYVLACKPPRPEFTPAAIKLAERAAEAVYAALAYDEIDRSWGKTVYLEAAARLREGWRPE